jgi:hypothetical protein
MFGRLVRAAIYFVGLGLVASILGFALQPMVEAMNAPYANSSQNSTIAGYFSAVSEWYIFVGLLSLIILLLAGALVESQYGGEF